MALKNYTTSISEDKTIAEIEKILATHGAKKILKDYDEEGKIKAVSFMIELEDKNLPFRLPMNLQSVCEVFRQQCNQGKLPRRYLRDTEQARRTGWRILKDWVDSQMAIFELNMVKMQEVFLPYMINPLTDKTLYETLESKGFSGYALEDKSNEEGNKISERTQRSS